MESFATPQSYAPAGYAQFAYAPAHLVEQPAAFPTYGFFGYYPVTHVQHAGLYATSDFHGDYLNQSQVSHFNRESSDRLLVFQVNQPSSYCAEMALSNNDFHPFKHDFFPVVRELSSLSTQNNNNYGVDLGKDQDRHQEQTAQSKDLSSDRSIGARSTSTYGQGSSQRVSDSTASNQKLSHLDLCELFLSSDNNSNQALSVMLDSQIEEEKLCETSLASFILNDEEDESLIIPTTAKAEPRKKKHKSTMFGTYGRSDIVYKTILRKCRKHYLTAFNDTTNYIKVKRNRKPQFLLEKLSEFVTKSFPSVEAGSELEQELVFFLGSMFYNKHMKKCFSTNSKKQSEIDEVHSCLYKFAIQKLSILEKYGAYSFIMRDFIANHKDRLLEKSKTLEKAKSDFILGFGEIEKRLCQ